MKTLIFSISAGDGHKQTSLAIKDYILLNDKNSEVIIVDTLSYISPTLNKLVIGSYIKSLKINPSIYGRLYYKIDSSKKLSVLKGSSKLGRLFSLKLKKLIYEFNPDIIISTHPIPTEMLSMLKTRGNMKIPVITIITDYAAHNFWLHKGIDVYITPNNDMINEMITKGIDKDKIYNLGIPVNPNFFKKYDKSVTLKSLNLSPMKFTILVMGGSLGMGRIIDLYKELDKIKADIQIIIATGKNNRLYCQLMKLKSNCLKETRVLKYTREINKYMQACDVLITKPGGITITEAMLSSIPLILFSPIPGQEEKNIDFLVKNHLAINLNDIEECKNTINTLITNPAYLQKIKRNYVNYIKPHSGNDIYNLINSLSAKDNLYEFSLDKNKFCTSSES
ncbi:MAG: glycosyltransferase [Clostridium sp.]|nr:glycosyltransferase [Clostridium sp.]